MTYIIDRDVNMEFPYSYAGAYFYKLVMNIQTDL